MKINAIKQFHSSGCGPSSIKMIADYFNLGLSKKTIETLCGGWKKEGMSNKELTKVLKRIGLQIKIKRDSSWSELIKNNIPQKAIIVSWMLRGYIGHFSVVEKVTEEAIWLADPNTGKIIKFDKIVFLRLWFDYDDIWYPKKVSDFKLRWMAIINKKAPR